MSVKTALPVRRPESLQSSADATMTKATSGRLDSTLEQDTQIAHRLRSASGHLKATAVAFETGQPRMQILHQLAAIAAALREIILAIAKRELDQHVNTLLTSGCDAERRAALRNILELYEKYWSQLGLR